MAVGDRNLTKGFPLWAVSKRACLWDLWKSPHEPLSPVAVPQKQIQGRGILWRFYRITCHRPSVHLSPFCERVCFAGSVGTATSLQQAYRPQQEAKIWGPLRASLLFLTRSQNGRAGAGALGYLRVCVGGWGLEGVGGESSYTSQLKACASSDYDHSNNSSICEAWRSKFSVFPGCPTSSSRLEPSGSHS